jgi:hypothetical protein
MIYSLQQNIPKGTHSMKRLTYPEAFENELSSMISGFFHQFGIAAVLKRVGAYKKWLITGLRSSLV